MKKPHTFRFDTDLIRKAHDQAEKENRTLTNWIETLIRLALEAIKKQKP